MCISRCVWLLFSYAWFKLFQLARTYNKNLTAADTQLMASSVVLAALAIPPYEASRNENEAELDRERGQRMAGILGFSSVRCSRPFMEKKIEIEEIHAAGVFWRNRKTRSWHRSANA